MSNPLGSVSGLASGMDWRALVSRIIDLEGQPAGALRSQVSGLQTRAGAWQQYRSLLEGLRKAAVKFRDGTAFRAASSTAVGQSSGGRPLVAATASLGALPGNYTVEVLSLAQSEKVSGASFASSGTALGLAGEFFVNGDRVEVVAADTLAVVRDKINQAAAASGTKVAASVLSVAGLDNRLVLTATRSGSAGVDLVDGGAGLLQQLGLLDATTTIKRATSAGAQGDRFSSSSATIASQRSATGPFGPVGVTIAGQVVTIDLSVDSLTSIAASIDALPGVSATVASEGTGASTRYYLDVSGTTSFVDSGHLLELLGIVEGGRAAVAQTVRGGVLTDGNGATPATSSTLLSSLWNGGSASGVQVGDTLTVTGTKGDGSAVSFNYAVGGGDTLQTILTALNSAATGFGVGVRPATASVDAQGRIQLTDSVSGDSQLSLSIVANNQGGGRLDLASFSASTGGRARQVTDGRDAKFRLDGVSFFRSSNMVTDAVAGVTLTLQTAEQGSLAQVTVERSSSDASAAAKDFVTAYNDIITFAQTQAKIGPEGAAAGPLAGQSALRASRAAFARTLLTTVSGMAADFTTASAAGISLASNGTIALDAAKFDKAYRERFADIEGLFSARGVTTDSRVNYVGYGAGSVPGAYDVVISAPATRAAVTGAGFSGTYADDGTPDHIDVTDTASGWMASVALSNGMTTAQIVSALSTAFGTAEARKIGTGATLYSDIGATTPVTAGTTWSSVYGAGGVPAGVLANDTISYVGTRADGTTFTGLFSITSPATGTVGDLVARLGQDFGSGVSVQLVGGRIETTSTATGPSLLGLTITAQNQGGGALNLGSVNVLTAGRGTLNIVASNSGGQVRLEHGGYGSGQGFTLGFRAGGANGTAQLGLAATPFVGQDVAGTIGGLAAVGSGQQLVGGSGTPVAGVHVEYAGTTAGTAGKVTLTLGVGAVLEQTIDAWTATGSGLLNATDASLSSQIARLEKRATGMESRLELRRTALLHQFAAMEAMVGKFQMQAGSLGTQLSGIRSALSS